MNNLIIDRSRLIEFQLTSTATRVPFAPINADDLTKGVTIYGIESFNASILAVSPKGNTVVSTLAGLAITLVDVDGVERAKDFPMQSLNRAAISGFINLVKDWKIDLTRSYVTIYSATSLSANQSVLVNIYYK